MPTTLENWNPGKAENRHPEAKRPVRCAGDIAGIVLGVKREPHRLPAEFGDPGYLYAQRDIHELRTGPIDTPLGLAGRE